jgi:hypothetical protein
MKMIAVVEVMDSEGDIFGSSFLFDTKFDSADDLIGLCFENIVDFVSCRVVELFVPTDSQLNRPIGLRGFDYNFSGTLTNSPRSW